MLPPTHTQHKAAYTVTHTGTHTHRFVHLTDCDGVDGVGVAVVVTVVVELTAVATGDHENAAKASSACNHAVLQRRLRRGNISHHGQKVTNNIIKKTKRWKHCAHAHTHTQSAAMCCPLQDKTRRCTQRDCLTLPSGWGPSTVRPSSSGPQLRETGKEKIKSS